MWALPILSVVRQSKVCLDRGWLGLTLLDDGSEIC